MYELVNIDIGEIENVGYCPWCHSNRLKMIESFETLELSKCKNCGLVFTSKRVKEEYIGKYYGSNYIERFSNASCQTEKAFIPFYKKELSNIKTMIDSRKLLEIGCGGGLFSGTAKMMGFDVVGQDIVKENIDNLKKTYEIDGFYGKLEDMKTNEKFDVMIMHHVLEHVYNLHSFLDTINHLLRTHGLLVVLIPNLFSIDGKIDNDLYKRMLSLPFHNYHFTKKTFKKIMGRKGFTVVLEDHSLGKTPMLALSKVRKIFNKSKCRDSNSNNTKSGSIIPQKAIKKQIARFLSSHITGEQLAFYLKKVDNPKMQNV